MPEDKLHQAHFTFRSAALEGEELKVLRFSGREQISQPFFFEIELVSRRANLDLDRPIGQPATLTLHGQGAEPIPRPYRRDIHGVLDGFEYVRSSRQHTLYRATLVPTLFPLSHTRDSRIFQKKTTRQIVLDVLNRCGLSGDKVQVLLHEPYEPRDYCVQYQESDLSFVNRLLEFEGIFYFFEPGDGCDVMVLGDGGHAFDAVPDRPHLPYVDQLSAHEEAVADLRCVARQRPGRVTLRDYRPHQPKLDLEASKRAERFDHLDVYQPMEGYHDPKLGNRLARVRLEELQCDSRTYIGQANCPALLPGHLLKLAGYPRDPESQEEYLVVALEHEGYQPESLQEEQGPDSGRQLKLRSRLTCIPRSTPYRPKRITERPSVPGVQTATVVGPPGEEIHCDEHGRVKVQFHWDREGQRNDASSTWIRVSQPWGGAGQGGMFIPRVGQEVVIQFLGGDPDRPLITGRVYNGENPVPHPLPAGKNISTIRSASTPSSGGFNELKFDDTAGSEQVFFHSQFNRDDVIGNNKTTQVGVNDNEVIGGDQTIEIGVNQSVDIGSNQDIHVGCNQSVSIDVDQIINISNNRNLDISVNDTIIIGVNQDITIGTDQSVDIGANQNVTIATDQNVTIGANNAISIGAVQEIYVSADQNLEVGGNQEITIGGNATTTITANQQITVNGSCTRTISGSLHEECGSKSSIKQGEVELVYGFHGAVVAGCAVDVAPVRIENDGVTIWFKASQIDTLAAKVDAIAAQLEEVATRSHTYAVAVGVSATMLSNGGFELQAFGMVVIS